VRAIEFGRSRLPALRLPSAPAALAAGGLAGIVTMLAVRILRRRRVKLSARGRRRGERSVVATRSFLVDVHVLGR
jgi:hypothetical protein